jgi:hypothetical protein
MQSSGIATETGKAAFLFMCYRFAREFFFRRRVSLCDGNSNGFSAPATWRSGLLGRVLVQPFREEQRWPSPQPKSRLGLLAKMK